MLASIGFVLILKQFPHLIGYDKDYSGDETFIQNDSNNTFSELINSVNDITPIALIIGILSILILLIWDRPALKKKKFFKNLPGPLVVVIVGILINIFFATPGNPIFFEYITNWLTCRLPADFASFTQFFYVSQMGISE